MRVVENASLPIHHNAHRHQGRPEAGFGIHLDALQERRVVLILGRKSGIFGQILPARNRLAAGGVYSGEALNMLGCLFVLHRSCHDERLITSSGLEVLIRGCCFQEVCKAMKENKTDIPSPLRRGTSMVPGVKLSRILNLIMVGKWES
jgi:hypothetical protein